MTSIYEILNDAVSAVAYGCEVIVLGSNPAASSTHWRLPVPEAAVHRYDALARPGSGVERALIHVYPGIVTFHEVDTSECPPATWIHGISSLRPDCNAQNLRRGSIEDRAFIRSHRRTRLEQLTPLRDLGTPGLPKVFLLDLEGMDFDIAMRLFKRSDLFAIGLEHALMTDNEVILLRCEAALYGFQFEFGDEDAVFIRPPYAI